MIELKLKADTNEQKKIKEYLENNVSETLAEKINNGVKIVKDNKTLINKKDLIGFMKYACEEARKQAEQGSNSACVEDIVVYGWAIHYFEEDTIEGKLYNEDGTEYQPPKVEVKKTTPTKPVKKEPENKQANLFDIFDQEIKAHEKQDESTKPLEEENEDNEEDEEFTNEEIDAILNESEEMEKEQKNTNPVYKKYLELQFDYEDYLTLIRVGDFYEAYGDNAENISNILNLTITTQDVGLKERVKLAGFPKHCKYAYLEKLAYHFDIAILEEDDEIKTIEKVEKDMVIDKETGEILEPKTIQKNSIDKEFAIMLYSVLEGKLEVK